MFIGDPQTFAIECYHEPIPNETKRVFGRMCIHSEGKTLGYIAEPACMLNVTEGHFEDLIGSFSLLDDSAISMLSDLEAFRFLDRVLYLDDDRTIDEVVRDAKKYSKFNFLTNGGESFDGTKSFIASNGKHVRILFTDKNDKFQSMHIHRDEFCKVVDDFFRWLKDESENVQV